MKKSESLVLTLFVIVIALICVGSVYVWAMQKDEYAVDSGDRYPTSIAVLDTIHRESFRAIKAAGHQEVAWVEKVDWGATGGSVALAVASTDTALAEKLRQIALKHEGVVDATVRLEPKLRDKAISALKDAGLEKWAFVSSMKGRIPTLTFAAGTSKENVRKVLEAVGAVPGVLIRPDAKRLLPDLVDAGNKALARAALDRRAIVDRADGRNLYVQIAGTEKSFAERVGKVLGAVPGVLSVKSTTVDLKGDSKLDNRAACQVLFHALKSDNKIEFDVGSAKIDEKSHALLDRLVDAAKRCISFRIEIGGHTDNTGDAGANVRLSGNRANAVVDYLVDKGVPRGRLRAKAFGDKQPVASNATDAGRARNRRIEFTILTSGENK